MENEIPKNNRNEVTKDDNTYNEHIQDKKTENVTDCCCEDENLSSDNSNKKRSDRPVVIGICLLLVLTLLSSAIVYFVKNEENKVAKGTSITFADKLIVDISDMTYDEAVEKINKLTHEYLSGHMSLTDPDKTVSVKPEDAGVSIDTSTAVNSVKDCLYTPYIIDSIKRHRNFSKSIPIIGNIQLDTKKLDDFINTHLQHIDKKPQDADISMDRATGEVSIKKEVFGRTLDRQQLINNLLLAAKQGQLESKTPTTDILPQVTEAKLKAMLPKKVMAEFSTNYGGSDWGRKENVRLGAAFLNNILLRPGQEFEYWEYVGDPSAERGFKPAGIYQNGKLAIGIGGGLCQVSTTLYNAALMADLKITERSPHGLPVYYVPLGLDSTVAIGWYTLKFVNTTDKFIIIKSSTNGSVITFTIHGDMPEGKTVKVYAKGLGGKAADAYRDVYMDGKLIRHDYLDRSYYK